MKQKCIFMLGSIICILALSALFFCFPASAKTFDVGPDLTLSEALDEAADKDIINITSSEILNKNISKNITINISSGCELSISSGDISISNAVINGRIFVLSGQLTFGENASINGELNVLYGSTVTIDGGSINAVDTYLSAIWVSNSTLNFNCGTITGTPGQFKAGIVASDNSVINYIGGTTTINGEYASGIEVYDSTLNITGGTIYGQFRAISSINSVVSAVLPAKIRTDGGERVYFQDSSINIEPGCLYNNPASKAVASLKMDITTSDTITLNIEDIGNKDIYCFDIPSSIGTRNDFRFYIAEGEENALATVRINSILTYGSSSMSYLTGYFEGSSTGTIVLNLRIGMYYNDTLEEKDIEVVLIQKDAKVLKIAPNVVTREWNTIFESLAFGNFVICDVYAGSTNAVISLPESENNKIKEFEILDANVSYEVLEENEYKIDFASQPALLQPIINIRVKYADETTEDITLYIRKYAAKVISRYIGEGYFDVYASYTAHESFSVEDPHLLVVYYYNRFSSDNEKIIEVKTFDISQYTPDPEGVYQFCIKESVNLYDTSQDTPDSADLYLISGDIGPDDEIFSGMVLENPWITTFPNYQP